MLQLNGLTGVCEEILASAEPTILMYPTKVDELSIPIGASKIGGRPDFPKNMVWPAWHEPMAFLAQVNLGDIEAYDAKSLLPHVGRLYFFYETNREPFYAELWGREVSEVEEWPARGDPRSWTVIYLEDNAGELSRRDFPESLNIRGRFPARSLEFALGVSLPNADSSILKRVPLESEERDRLIGLRPHPNRNVLGRPPWHRLLGIPFTFVVPPVVRAYCESQGRVIPDWYQNLQGNRGLQTRAEAEWVLLMQLDSDDGMEWSGSGVIDFFIERDRLACRDFSRTWLTLERM